MLAGHVASVQAPHVSLHIGRTHVPVRYVGLCMKMRRFLHIIYAVTVADSELFIQS